MIPDLQPVKTDEKPKENPNSGPKPALKKAVSIKSPLEKKSTEDGPEEYIAELEDFSQPDLEKYWNEFIEKCRLENKAALVAMLTSNTPVKSEEAYKVMFHLSHKAQEIMMDEIRMEITQFLRKKLRNREILLQTEVKANENLRKPFSAQEKFEQLAKENPGLITFKNRFNLDLDF